MRFVLIEISFVIPNQWKIFPAWQIDDSEGSQDDLGVNKLFEIFFIRFRTLAQTSKT